MIVHRDDNIVVEAAWKPERDRYVVRVADRGHGTVHTSEHEGAHETWAVCAEHSPGRVSSVWLWRLVAQRHDPNLWVVQ